MKVEMYNDGDLVKILDFELARGISKGDYIQIQESLYKVYTVCYVIGDKDRVEKLQLEVNLED